MKTLLTVAATATLLLACMASPTTATDNLKPVTLVTEEVGGGVYRFCDSGRLIYVFDGYKAGGIAVSDQPCTAAD